MENAIILFVVAAGMFGLSKLKIIRTFYLSPQVSIMELYILLFILMGIMVTLAYIW